MKPTTASTLALFILASASLTAAEVVVTASRLPEASTAVPASVSVIGPAELRNTPAQHVDDAIRTTPGVYVLRSAGMGYGLPVQINLRGVPGQHAVLLLADGLPMSDAVAGFEAVNEVALESVQRIEVVRGPFSALYGADAFAGVINVISLDPEQRPTVAARARAGNEGFTEFSLQGSGGDRAAGFTIDFSTRSIDNALAQDTIIDRQWDPTSGSTFERELPADNYDYRDTRLHGKLTADLGEDAHIDVIGRYSDSEQGYGMADYRPLFPAPVETDMENESAMLGVLFTSSLTPRLSLKSRAYYRDQQRRLRGLDVAGLSGGYPVFARSQSHTDGRDWFGDVALDAMLGTKHTLTVGSDFTRNDGDFSPLYDAATGEPFAISMGRRVHSSSVGLYAQDRAALSDRLQLLSGIRVDEHSVFGSAVSPKAGLLFKATDRTRLRTSVGRAYRAPTLTELYQPDINFGSVTFQSNPDLEPEYILSADLGLDHDLPCGLALHADLFYNDMSDLITKQIDGSVLRYANTDDAESYGLETGLALTLATGCVVNVTYTEQRGEVGDSGADLEHIPERLFTVGLRLSHALGRAWRGDVSVTEHYVGDRSFIDLASGQRQELDAYWRTDASLRLTFNDTLWLGATIENATDTTYQEWPLINPAPGRLYALEVGGQW
ncbi:MAG: TonB-dependent receptor [Kiritimatiellia bacterium]|jgi:outer membrane receptor for ferrienterochelin and colicin|nr:TonB-dependent receptor [Kiritimatiellia bacterium]MDP6809582.1 TonB-dependent receptor [Kiritimatiellia bacterium]MDP7023567.1 TonB-dependent receptor [Kiritimatiellia bacterium]